MSKKSIPDGFTAITPHLVCKDAAAAIEFYRKAFGIEELGRLTGPGGVIMHADLRLGDTTLWLAEENPNMGLVGPRGGSPVTLNLYVADAKKSFQAAIQAGAKPVMEVTEMFWGDLYGRLVDPFGHNWAVAQRVKQLSPAEVQQAFQRAFGV